MDTDPNQSTLLPEDAAGKNSSDKNANQYDPGEQLLALEIGFGNIQNVPSETLMVESVHLGHQDPGQHSEDVTRNEQPSPRPEEQRECIIEQLGLPAEDEEKKPRAQQMELPREDEHGDGATGKTRRKKRSLKRILVDEFSRTRTQLRYLLNRMDYEQNLIDVYSVEGWKGQSLEKIKPEKELQRAKYEIFRCKLEIRDLFQRLDLSIAEGRLPDSLFDSEGQIDSEDIFCAKCGSKDLPTDNDIILCDGACERGFHQFCLEPPLLKQDKCVLGGSRSINSWK